MPPPPLSAPRDPKSDHLHYLDGLRALAALFVVFHHARLQVWPLHTKLPPQGWVHALTGGLLYGHFAVDLFIVLSGFCLMLPVARGGGVLPGGPARFFARRARRILPPYYAALALSLLLIQYAVGQKTGTHWDNSVPVTRDGFWAHVLLLQDVFSPVVGGQINHAFWSIAVECHVYLWFPALVACWRRCGAARTTLAAVLGGYALHFVLDPAVAGGMHPHYLGLFALGMLAAHLVVSPTRIERLLCRAFPWRFVGAGMALTVGLSCVGAGWARTSADFMYLDTLAGLCALCLLLLVSRPGSRAGALLGARPLRFLGGFAYSLYLVHAPLLQLVWQYGLHPLHLPRAATFVLLLLIGTPLILGAAYGFFLGFERPFLGGGSVRTGAALPVRPRAPRPAPAD